MKAIRGAITVECDTPEEIRGAVKELLFAVRQDNELSDEHIICIIFSSTADIHSLYPAKAAREAGFVCPLFSALEPEIDGSLPLCIRVLVLYDKDIVPKHIYLRKAVSLRKDLSGKINIAVDGPAGSGKSTVTKIIADKLKILYLDTGAMYRAFGYKCLKSCIDFNDEKAVTELFKTTSVTVSYDGEKQLTFVDGEEVSRFIRTPQISMLASKVSSYKAVRIGMVELQRQIAKENSCILDGRDIGTNVLPDADFKFFVTASPEVRATRRYKELCARGDNADYSQILADIRLRDKQDETREIAPLRCAEDAIKVDTSEMTIDEVCTFILNKIQEKI